MAVAFAKGTIAERWRSIHWFFRLVCGGVACVLIGLLSVWLGAISLFLGIILLSAAAFGALYAHGTLPWIEKYKELSKVLERYAPREETTGGTSVTGTRTKPPSGFATSELSKQPSWQQSDFHGLGEVREQLNRLVGGRKIIGRHGASSRCVLLLGPPGTGKKRVARVLAKELLEAHLVTADKMLEISKEKFPEFDDPFGLPPEVLDCIEGEAAGVAAGVILLDDLDWLRVRDGGKLLGAIGARLNKVRDAAEQPLTIVATGSAEFLQRLEPCHEWLKPFSIRPVRFKNLDESALVAIAVSLLDQERIGCTPEAREELRKHVKDIKMIDDFQNATSIGHFIDCVLQYRLDRIYEAEDMRTDIVFEDVRKAFNDIGSITEVRS